MVSMKTTFATNTPTETPSRSTLWHRTTTGTRFEQVAKHRAKAAERNIEWLLTDEEYAKALGEGTCHYCKADILTGGVGLDRKDNAIGYVVSNVVPCCYSCNDEKSSTISFEEYEWLWRFRTSRAEAEAEIARRRIDDADRIGSLCGTGIEWRASIAERAEKRECGLSPDAEWPSIPTTTVFEWRTRLGITQDQAVALLTRLGENGWSRRSMHRFEHQPFVSSSERKALALEASKERATRDLEKRGNPRPLICSVCGESGHNKRRHT